MHRLVSLAAVVLAAVFVLYGAVGVLDVLARSGRTSTRALGPVRALEVDLESGPIEVHAGRGAPRVRSHEVIGLFGAPRLSVLRGPGDRVRVRTSCPWTPASCSSSASVEVPPGTPVRLRTDSGDVTLRGLRGGAEVRTDSGGVNLLAVGGASVRVETGSGDVTATALEVRDLTAATGSGAVRLSAARAPSSLAAATSSGEVALEVPDVGYRVDAQTDSGQPHVEVRQDPRAARRLALQTGSGDVVVRPR